MLLGEFWYKTINDDKLSMKTLTSFHIKLTCFCGTISISSWEIFKSNKAR